jgi:hypothetical protein
MTRMMVGMQKDDRSTRRDDKGIGKATRFLFVGKWTLGSMIGTTIGTE